MMRCAEVSRQVLVAVFMLLTTTTVWAEVINGGPNSFGTNATWSYDTSTHTLTISGTGALTGYNSNTVNLQDDTRPFTAYKDDCTTIVINEGITSIGNRDFAYMYNVTSVSIPASVTTIADYAFYRGGIYAAITFTIAASSQLSSIGNNAFMRTLATIDLSGCTSLTTIPTYAFLNCADVTLPNTMTSAAGGGLKWTTHVYVAPKSGYSLAVNGTPVAVGSNGKYDVTSLVNNDDAITFTWITPRDLTNATLTLTNAKEGNWYAYQNGAAITVNRSVQDANGTGLTENTDYTVSITNSSSEPVTSITAEDTYTLTVTGTGSKVSGYFGSVQTTFTVEGPIALTSETTAWRDGRSYYAEGEVTIGSRATVSGTVTLDLRAGSSLTVTGGISVNEGNSLTISGTGTLTTTASNYNASIGGNQEHSSGNITISGCTVNATATFLAAAIGGGAYGDNGTQDTGTSTITLNGCVVTATSASTGPAVAAIGAGMRDASHTYNVNINGGQVTVNNNGQSTRSGYIKGNVNLDWTDFANDFIEADGYSGTFTFAHPFQYDNSGTPTIVTAETIGSLGGKRLTPYAAQTYTVTFVTGDGATTVATQTLPEGYTATRPADPLRTGYRFVRWLNGSAAYDFSAAVNANLTLTAEWQAVSAISYIDTNGQTVSGFTQYIPLEAGHTTLDGNICPTWVVDADLTQSSRITIKNNVTLILTDGKTLTAQKGISVTADDKAALTVLAQSGGTGALTVTGVKDAQNDACIGGEHSSNRWSCGTVSIYGGRITTSGNFMGAGIGGANSAPGGTISILGGQVDISGGSYGGNAIGYGYGYESNTPTTITLGWRNATDYILLRPGSNGSACCKGTVTLASQFLLDGTTTKARWTSESDNNVDSHKLVPKEVTVWADIQEALTAGQTITLTNDVSSQSGEETLVVPAGKTATIDLNGHTLTHGYATTGGDTGNKDYVIMMLPNATLTISDGSTDKTGRITGNMAGIYNAGTLTLTNVALSGFGSTGNKLAIDNHGTLTMTDVSVTGNTGGIYNAGTLNLAGKVTVTGNTMETSAYNVFLSSGCVITLTGALTSDSRIGVGGAYNSAITSGANGKATLANFISDDADEYICWTTDGSEVQMNQLYFINERDGMADLVSRHQGETLPVCFTRTFTDGVATTICLPFDIYPTTYEDYGTFYRFVGVDESTSPWTVTMEETVDPTIANTPMLFMPKQTGGVTFEPYIATVDDDFTVASSYTAGTVPMDDWMFTGTYERINWLTDAEAEGYTQERAEEIGKIYGFAAQAGTSTDGQNTAIEAGKFFRVAGGPNSYAQPFRAYLKYTGTAHARSTASGEEHELPTQMIVRLIGSNGETTSLNEEFRVMSEKLAPAAGWYTLDGRELDKQPTSKGVYIHEGRKVVIK